MVCIYCKKPASNEAKSEAPATLYRFTCECKSLTRYERRVGDLNPKQGVRRSIDQSGREVKPRGRDRRNG